MTPSYKAFQSYQDMIKELFGVFYKVCEENNIRYYTFGTLLGIIRDGGMIPWDADIDIMLPITEAEQDIKILSEKLPEDYYLVSNYIDPNYYLCETRMCKKGYDPDIFHIDFFYLIGAPDDEKERRKYRKTVRKRPSISERTGIGPSRRATTGEISLYIIRREVYQILAASIPNSVINSRCEKLMHKYDMDKCSYYTSWDDRCHVPCGRIRPDQERKEGQEYCAILLDSERVLEPVYSDFRSYMPVARRFDEFYTSVQRLTDTHRGF